MSVDGSPADRIDQHRTTFARLSDAEVLARLAGLEPLPETDDLDPAWDDDAFDRAEKLIAFADEVGERRLVEGIAPVFERAALGDAFEMMQSIRHGPEKAVAGDWPRLTGIMRPLASHSRPGTRRWAIRELGLLRDPSGLPELLAGIDDQTDLVRYQAYSSLGMLDGVLEGDVREDVRRLVAARALADPSDEVRAAARWALV